MKKIALTLAAALIAVTSIFCFAGCGDSPEQKITNYIESDSFKSQFDSMKSAYSSVMDVDIKAEGEKAVMTFTCKTDIPDDTFDTVKSTFEQSIDSMSATFESFADEIKDNAGVDNPSVVIEINTKDGKSLFSKTYNATK